MANDSQQELIGQAHAKILAIRKEMARRIIGKDELVSGLLAGLLSGGHVLLEGLPGLAKTLAVKSFAQIIGLKFSRVQFTPDLLPGDITGTIIYEHSSGKFVPRKGPLFANIILADEVNRAPAKVQAALLEAMEEKQVTLGDKSEALPSPFLVLATQNPIEHEGTYPLPEAQLDRFFIKLITEYPTIEEETRIVKLVNAQPEKLSPIIDASDLAMFSKAVEAISVDDSILDYIVRLVHSTRAGLVQKQLKNSAVNANASAALTASANSSTATANSAAAKKSAHAPTTSAGLSAAEKDIARWVEFGASPRASINLFRAARINALFGGRNFVSPDDVKESVHKVLRHRLVLSYQAEADAVNQDMVIDRILASVAQP